jgi:hypothetical protein
MSDSEKCAEDDLTPPKSPKMMYISITGLVVRGFWQVPSFWYHAIPSKMQADSAEGVLFSETKDRNSVHHTLTAWENKAAMRAYMLSGAHKVTNP